MSLSYGAVGGLRASKQARACDLIGPDEGQTVVTFCEGR